MVDYIINAVKSTAPGAELSEDTDIDIRDGFSGWEWIVLNICEVHFNLSGHISPALCDLQCRPRHMNEQQL